MIKMIAALTPNRVIGADNKLLWYYPEDLKRFKELTYNQVVVMGSLTYESIGRPLRGRTNVILTSRKYLESLQYMEDNLIVMHSLEECMMLKDFWVIGGGRVYEQFLPYADRLELTHIHEEYEGDTYFPPYEDQFRLVNLEKHDHFSYGSYQRWKEDEASLSGPSPT